MNLFHSDIVQNVSSRLQKCVSHSVVSDFATPWTVVYPVPLCQWPCHSLNLFSLELKSVKTALEAWTNSAQIKLYGQDGQKLAHAMGKPHELFLQRMPRRCQNHTENFSSPAPCKVHTAHSLSFILFMRLSCSLCQLPVSDISSKL